MERNLAVRMLAALEALNPGLNEATAVTMEMADQEESRFIRRHLGMIMSGPLFDIVMHIVKQHPDLDPDKGLLK